MTGATRAEAAADELPQLVHELALDADLAREAALVPRGRLGQPLRILDQLDEPSPWTRRPNVTWWSSTASPKRCSRGTTTGRTPFASAARIEPTPACMTTRLARVDVLGHLLEAEELDAGRARRPDRRGPVLDDELVRGSERLDGAQRAGRSGPRSSRR